MNYHILHDFRTRVILAMNTNAFVINLLEESIHDSIAIYDAHRPNHTSTFPLSGVKRDQYTKWAWNPAKRLVSEHTLGSIDNEIVKRSRIAIARGDAFMTVIRSIGNIRIFCGTGVFMQDYVYTVKRLQAEAFRAAGYDESRALEFPFVLQYADLKNIPLKQAADDILFKARLDDELLSRTEVLRLKYFDLIRNAKHPSDLSQVMQNFNFECNAKQLV